MKMANAYLVVRIKGQADCPYWATTTMTLLKLDKKYRATILPAKENTLGMLNKVKHYVSWIELDAALAKELIDKKARKSGYQKITADDLKELGFASSDELAAALSEGKATLSKLKPLKPWFALAPPRYGFKRSTKRLYGQKGVLGQNKDLGTLVRNMM
jgi:large subunit ribosomal protein L30